MDRKETIHYHIRWAQIPLLDFESFNTRVEAEAAAQVLARQGEKYTIEEKGDGCQRCRDATKAKSERGRCTSLSRTRVMLARPSICGPEVIRVDEERQALPAETQQIV